MTGIFCVFFAALLGFGLLLFIGEDVGIYILLGLIFGVLCAIYIQLDSKLKEKIKSIMLNEE
jgi:hypothetical protein